MDTDFVALKNKMAIRVVLISASSEELATKLAKALVKNNLAACVNILPGVTSYFQWMGKLQSASELILICKTVEPRLPDLITLVKEMHDYEIPEIISLPVLEGLPSYCQWIFDSTIKKEAKS